MSSCIILNTHFLWSRNFTGLLVKLGFFYLDIFQHLLIVPHTRIFCEMQFNSQNNSIFKTKGTSFHVLKSNYALCRVPSHLFSKYIIIKISELKRACRIYDWRILLHTAVFRNLCTEYLCRLWYIFHQVHLVW